MPSKNNFNRTKPWRACVKRGGKVYNLGTYYTYEQAARVEDEFKAENPGPGKAWPEHAREASVKARQAKKTVSVVPKLVEPKPVGNSREAVQERARLRAIASMR